MNGNKPFFDIGALFDEIFSVANQFSERAQETVSTFKRENVDFYPSYTYPPMNVWIGKDRQMVFEFALAGFDEKNISLSFQGNYMFFSATMEPQDEDEDRQYFKRRLRLKDIERQKYYVPADKYEQEETKAVTQKGILKITIPAKKEIESDEGIEIKISSED